MFLSVCTIYFLNIKGSGNLFSRQSIHSFFNAKHFQSGVRTVKMAAIFFYLLRVFVCIMLTEIVEIVFFFILP